jgi:cellulose synthase/poly-beta-1,6-N-acetylglucosamine synthase-like glycosyltransferase
MKRLEVPHLSQLRNTSSLAEVSSSLDKVNKHAIDLAPWPQFDYVPKVRFGIAHNNDCILLKYEVEEKVLKAAYYKPDDPVYKDSCVEFFIAFDGEEYYNLEFNAIGTCKLNFGRNRYERIVVSEKLVRAIKHLSVIQNPGNAVQWELSLVIPKEVFSQHKLTSFSGRVCRANFYKCGDDLPTPHFLCWNRIETPEPDFHVPEDFGEISFL